MCVICWSIFWLFADPLTSVVSFDQWAFKNLRYSLPLKGHHSLCKKNALWIPSFTTQWCSCLQKECRCSKLVLSCVEMMKGSEKELTNGVSGGFLALLVHAVVTSNCPVSSFWFNGLAIGADQHAGHHPQRAIAYTVQVSKVQCLLWTAPSNSP